LTPPLSDTSPTYETTLPYFATVHPSPIKPTVADIVAIRTLASLVSRRSSALLAASVFSLWELRHETQAEYIESVADAKDVNDTDIHFVAEAAVENALPRTKVAFNGSVIERYPGYLPNCQQYINELVSTSAHAGAVDLVPALESSILGAAVALACVATAEQDL
jgi:hexokinase